MWATSGDGERLLPHPSHQDNQLKTKVMTVTKETRERERCVFVTTAGCVTGDIESLLFHSITPNYTVTRQKDIIGNESISEGP